MKAKSHENKNLLFPLSLFLIASQGFFLSGCLKTRAQITDNNDRGDRSSEVIDARQSASTSRKSAANSSYELEEMRNEVMRLTGKVEEIDHIQKTSNAADVRESLAKMEGRIIELEKNQVLILTELKEVKDRGTNSSTQGTAASSESSSQGPRSLILEGYKLLETGEHDEAAEKFRLALGKKPKSSESADAHFGLGEAEFEQKNYKKAIVEYSKVQESFPKSPRVPASLYKIGLSFQNLNMMKESRDFFAELQERYPKSAEAKKARAKSKTK